MEKDGSFYKNVLEKIILAGISIFIAFCSVLTGKVHFRGVNDNMRVNTIDALQSGDYIAAAILAAVILAVLIFLPRRLPFLAAKKAGLPDKFFKYLPLFFRSRVDSLLDHLFPLHGHAG